MLIETAAIQTVFGKTWSFLKSIPREVWYIFVAALFLWWFAGVQYDRGYDKREAEYAEAARLAAEHARKADTAAGETVTRTTEEVEQGNAKARDAADGSDDPLRSALDSLRED